MPASGHTLAERIEQEEREVRLYADAVALYTSIYLYFQRYQFTVHVESTVRAGVESRQLIPDLLVKTTADWTVIEHKGSLPKSQKKMAAELDEIGRYGQTTVFDRSTFNPQVVLLCPRKLAGDLIALQEKKQLQLPTLISYSPPTERVCNLIQEQGELRDVYLKDLFAKKENRVEMDIETIERYKYKFIRREPPVPYTTHFIWGFINLSKSAFQKKITVQYSGLIQRINDFCPPWCSEARQLSDGRLNKTIQFLKRLGWIKFEKGTNEITADTSRGTKAGRMEEYLCRKFVEYTEEVPEGKERGEAEKPVIVRPLEDFL